MCLGMNPDTLAEGERCASTSNRNFEGRQGKGGRTHLVSPKMAAAAAVEGHFVDIRRLELSMRPIDVIEGKVVGAGPRRRRHRPDHPQAVPQAGRADRLRRVPLLRLDPRRRDRARAEPDPRHRAATSAAAPRASTPPGRSRTSASRRSSRPPSPTSSTRTARRSGCCRSILDEEHCRAVAEAGEARIDLDDETVNCAGRRLPVRDRAGDQAPAAERPRRHRRSRSRTTARSTTSRRRGGRRRPGDDGAVSDRRRGR